MFAWGFKVLAFSPNNITLCVVALGNMKTLNKNEKTANIILDVIVTASGFQRILNNHKAFMTIVETCGITANDLRNGQ